jgi:hypothetical protein
MALVTGKVFVVLDSDQPHSGPTWNTAFLTLSKFSGNTMIRLFSETRRDGAFNWNYPPDKFRRDLLTIRELSGRDFMPFTLFRKLIVGQ